MQACDVMQVLTEPPDDVLPWMETMDQASFADPSRASVAAPCDVRLRAQLPLVSATHRILDGVCRYLLRE